MTPINVLEVIRQGKVGGGESHLLDLIAGFDDTVKPIVLSFTGGQMIDILTKKGVKCYVIETTYPFDLRIMKQVKKIIEKEKIQLIHAHGSRAALNVALTSRILHIPLIYTVHGWSFHQDQSMLTRKLRACSEKIICQFCREVICVSTSNYITGKETFGLKHAIIIENGIDLDKFKPEDLGKDIRQEFGFSKDDFIVGFIGRVTRQKAPLDFVKSIAIAHKQEPRIKALFIGEGDMDDETQMAIKEYKMDQYICTAPFRKDIADIHSAIDVFCLPSLWEGLSIALLEAMAMGKAIAATPTDGTKEVIKHEQNGLIADFENPETLANCYLTYYHHPDLKRKYGHEAMKMVRVRFDSYRVSERVTDIYRNNLPEINREEGV